MFGQCKSVAAYATAQIQDHTWGRVLMQKVGVMRRNGICRGLFKGGCGEEEVFGGGKFALGTTAQTGQCYERTGLRRRIGA